MADAVEVLDDGNLALFHDRANQAFATAGDDEVETVVALQKHAHEIVARFGHELHGVLVDAVSGKRFVEDTSEALCGVERFLAAAQDHGIASLEAEASAVDGHVGAAFENEKYGADRHGDTANLDTILEFAAFEHLVQRVSKGGNFFGSLGHGFDSGIVQCETVHLRVVELSGGGFEIQLVRGKDFRLLLAEHLGDEVQYRAPLFSGERAEILAGLLGILGQDIGIFFQVGI